MFDILHQHHIYSIIHLEISKMSHPILTLANENLQYLLVQALLENFHKLNVADNVLLFIFIFDAIQIGFIVFHSANIRYFY